jgi:hypothetical protein
MKGQLLSGGPMRPSALRQAVGIRSRIHFSRYYMTPLMEKGLVRSLAIAPFGEG